MKAGNNNDRLDILKIILCVILFVIFYYERNHILPNEEGKNPNASSLRIVR